MHDSHKVSFGEFCPFVRNNLTSSDGIFSLFTVIMANYFLESNFVQALLGART